MNINSYPLDTTIYVDTNNEEVINLLKKLDLSCFKFLMTGTEYLAFLLGPPENNFAYDKNYKGKFFVNSMPLFELNHGKISSKCYCYHISNNYCDNPESKYGK